MCNLVSITHPRTGSTAMPTGKPTPREVPSLAIRVFPYLVSPWSVITCSPRACIRTEFLSQTQRQRDTKLKHGQRWHEMPIIFNCVSLYFNFLFPPGAGRKNLRRNDNLQSTIRAGEIDQWLLFQRTLV